MAQPEIVRKILSGPYHGASSRSLSSNQPQVLKLLKMTIRMPTPNVNDPSLHHRLTISNIRQSLQRTLREKRPQSQPPHLRRIFRFQLQNKTLVFQLQNLQSHVPLGILLHKRPHKILNSPFRTGTNKRTQSLQVKRTTRYVKSRLYNSQIPLPLIPLRLPHRLLFHFPQQQPTLQTNRYKSPQTPLPATNPPFQSEPKKEE